MHAHSPQDRSSTVISRKQQRNFGRSRQGAAVVLGVVLTLSLVTLMAFTMDYGNIYVAQSELRRSADSAAMAACWEMFDHQEADHTTSVSEDAVRESANATAYFNTVGRDALQFSVSDVELGYYDITQPSDFDAGSSIQNAVRVTLRRQTGANGELPLFFGSLTGRDSQALTTTATAAMLSTVEGFYSPSITDYNIEMLPIALDLPSWLQAVANATDDDYAYSNGTVSRGSDGLFETNLYPKGTGLPGNRGTVDIGGDNNSTQDLARQVLYGISEQDYLDFGRPLRLDENGELDLNGDTGISAGIKDELASLIGKKRIIPIYDAASGEGDNSTFTVVRFEGVRILDVKLTGKKENKRVIIQPAKVLARGGIIDTTGTHTSSHLVTPVMLVQ